MVYTCRDGTASMRFGFDKYTSEELEVLNDDNHCLSYFYSFQDEEPAKEDCFEAVILNHLKMQVLHVDIMNSILNIQMELQRHIKHAIYSIVKRLLKDNWTIKVRNLLKPT